MILSLAPMQDVTDLAFMRCLTRVGSLPDYFVTAYFRSTSTTCAFTENNIRCLEENETGRPIWAQLAGSEASDLARDAEMLLGYNVAGIDLNAGCPSPLVNRHNAGAGLLRDLLRFSTVLAALRSTVPAGRFSVKCRLGWEDVAEFPRLLELIAEAQPDLVAVHARTRKQLYGGQPDLSAVRDAVRFLAPCPVVANGNIITPEDARRWMDFVAPAGLMIGRGAVRNPFIFRQLKGGAAPSEEEMHNYYRILIEETGRILHTKRTERGHCNRMKKYLAFIYPNLAPQREYALRRCVTVAEMERLLTMPRED